MRACLERAAEIAPASRREDLRIPIVTARAYEQLFRAAALRDSGDAAALDGIRDAYVKVLEADPTFKPFADQHAVKLYETFTAWLANGFRNGYF